MNVNGWLRSVAARALAESMDVHTMTALAKRLFGSYDLYERTGFPANLSIPNKNAAEQIVSDIRSGGLFLDFVTLLIQIHEVGLKGRKYRIPYLRSIVGELKKEGLIYDEGSKSFFEDMRVRTSRNWGVLREGVEYMFTFLRVDVVGNTRLVKRNPGESVRRAYRQLREMVQAIIERRNGRIWNWEGDGGLAAFRFSNMENRAALSAIEILNELFLYNLILCRLSDPLSVRIAVHSGPCEYRSGSSEMHSDTLKTVSDLEARFTMPDSATFSALVHRALNPLITERLEPISSPRGETCYRYQLKWET